jgi:hypothetical protein
MTRDSNVLLRYAPDHEYCLVHMHAPDGALGAPDCPWFEHAEAYGYTRPDERDYDAGKYYRQAMVEQTKISCTHRFDLQPDKPACWGTCLACGLCAYFNGGQEGKDSTRYYRCTSCNSEKRHREVTSIRHPKLGNLHLCDRHLKKVFKEEEA